MPCEVDDLEVGEKVHMTLDAGAICSDCQSFIVQPYDAVIVVYVGFNTRGQHIFFTTEKMTCPKCGGTANEFWFDCGNTARGLFSLIGYQELEESTEAESLVIIEAPRRSTYDSPKNSVTLWE